MADKEKHDEKEKKIDLVGRYKNELDSIMQIQAVDGSSFYGTYHTAVSAKGTSLVAQMNGKYNESDTPGEGVIAFSVNWKYVKDEKNVFSTSSWNGIVRKNGQIHTMWLLTRYCPALVGWNATSIGYNIFTKMQ